jgi:hypothetical protein
MPSKVASGIAWVGRTTSMVFGLALVMALIVGAGTTALAAVPGDPFKLGGLNAVNALTQLVGGTNGALLKVQNLSSGNDAAALELRVEAGKTPMRVSGGAGKATGLNADAVDGKNTSAFFSGKTYDVEDGRVGPGGGQVVFRSVSCDEGDALLGGAGGASVSDGDDLRSSGLSEDTWFVFVQDNNSPSGVVAEALCADFPPLRP